MATRVHLRYILMTPLNCLTSMQESQLYLFCKPSYSNFCAKICFWHKNPDSVSFVSQVIAIFLPKFVALATRVHFRYILMTPLNCLTAKTPCAVQESRMYLFCKPSYSYFCAKIRCHGNKGPSEIYCNDTVNLPDLEDPWLEQESRLYLFSKPSYSYFVPKFVTMATRIGQT